MFNSKNKNDENFKNLLDGSMDGESFEIIDEMDDYSGNEDTIELINDINANKNNETINSESNGSNGKKNKIKNPFKKSKKKSKNAKKSDNGSFIDIGESPNVVDEFVIVGDNSGKFRNFINSFKIVIGIFLFIVITIIVYLLMSFRIIPENIKGANYNISNNSIISRNYQPNLDELKIGDELICANDKIDWSPLIFDYSKLKFKSRNGAIIFTEDENGNTKKIQSVDIDYIIKE